MDSFANRVKKLRKEKGLKQEELAEALSTSKGTVSIWERGGRRPEQRTIKRIADLFEVSVAYILGYSDMREVYVSSSDDEALTGTAKEEEVEGLAKMLIQMSPETLSIVGAAIKEGYIQDSNRGVLDSLDKYHIEVTSSILHESNMQLETLEELEGSVTPVRQG